MDRFDELIIRAKAAAPSYEGVLAAVAARPIEDGVGAASRIWRAAALIALAAGVGALAALLPGIGVGSPAAGDVSTSIDRVTDSLERLESTEQFRAADRIASLNARLDAVETARRENVRVALYAAIREGYAEKKERERQWRIERHVAQVRGEYASRMDERLAELRSEGLSDDQLERAEAILEQHGVQAQELVRKSYEGRDGALGDKFELLARETEDRLSRVTGQHQWRDILGGDTEQWAPTADLDDWHDFDNLMDWMRHTSRS
jgi:hypothetical protein